MRVSSMPIVGKIPRPASDRPDQNFWPAAPTSGLATRVLLEDTSAISAAFHFHRANAFRSSTCSLEFHDRRRRVWRKERVLLVRRISRIFVMEEEASSTSGRPTLWSHRNRELERDKGELGWKLGVVRFESQILERWGGYFFQSFWVPGAIRTLFDSLQMHRTLLWTVPSHRGF